MKYEIVVIAGKIDGDTVDADIPLGVEIISTDFRDGIAEFTCMRPVGLQESKVVFLDGGKVRALRGIVTEKGDGFTYVSRRDGEFKISVKDIKRVEKIRRDSSD